MGLLIPESDEAGREARLVLGVRPARLALLRIVIANGEVTAQELMDALGMTRNGVGLHLKVLTDAGLLTERHATHPRGTGGIHYWSANVEIIRDTLDTLSASVLNAHHR
ncbi:ArsR/SmtB family transcription factor [Plantibacter sp. RU18]|uniref:ArsR/SmtB family transcription factor n=1 Tax=Plantibacter sp. RU18 TaxID=3158143 RepID=UPI003D368975